MRTYSQSEIESGRHLLQVTLSSISITDIRYVHGLTRSPLANGLMDRVKMDNLEALVVYQTQEGWSCDLLLKNLPIGSSTSIGNPEASPYGSYDEALDFGKEMVLCVLAQSRISKASYDMSDEREFDLFGHIFAIPGKVVDDLARRKPYISRSTRHLEGSRARLKSLIQDVVHDGYFDVMMWNVIPEEQRKSAIGEMIVQLVAGSNTYP